VPNPTTAGPRVSDSATDTDVWKPAPRTSWQWQLNDLPIDSSFDDAVAATAVGVYGPPTIPARHGKFSARNHKYLVSKNN
tara:strand:- start:905 stop:1144 length:240 start_codon:yes stop_codon:yes gene_type:complete